jgi:hypothetical protein
MPAVPATFTLIGDKRWIVAIDFEARVSNRRTGFEGTNDIPWGTGPPESATGTVVTGTVVTGTVVTGTVVTGTVVTGTVVTGTVVTGTVVTGTVVTGTVVTGTVVVVVVVGGGARGRGPTRNRSSPE